MAREGRNPYLIAEMDHTVFVVGDNQFHKGYTLVLLKDHVRELHELAPAVQLAQFSELMRATRAVQATFEPLKLNHACYGNTEPHVHWHVFPRYEDDPDHNRNPWLHADRFADYRITPAEAERIAARIRGNFA
jgi:diadenosine tetraphosphate (Ap4A) HIT family hydrolase